MPSAQGRDIYHKLMEGGTEANSSQNDAFVNSASGTLLETSVTMELKRGRRSKGSRCFDSMIDHLSARLYGGRLLRLGIAQEGGSC